MVPFHRGWFLIAVLTLAVQTSYSQEALGYALPENLPEDHRCVIYSLEGLGDDPALGKWVAETIPEVVEPGSWNQKYASGKKNVLTYYAPKRILIISHSASVQKKVDEFLQGVKSAVAAKEKMVAPTRTAATAHSGVVPASYQAPAGVPQNLISPLPTPAQQPKHLFHFIIRYEGAGIIDDSVNKFMKLQKEDKPRTNSNAERAVEGTPAVQPTPASEGSEEKVERYVPATLVVPATGESWKQDKQKEEKKTMPGADE